MQFLMDNYIWFLVAGIIGLMTVIGYIAEKTDFGRKEIKREESKEKKVKKDVKKLEESNLKLNDVVYTDTKNIEVIEDEKVEEPDVFAFNDLNIPIKEEDLTVSLNGEKANNEENKNLIIEEDLTVHLNNNNQNEVVNNFVNEDLTVPLSGKVEEPVTELNVNVDEDLTVPLNATTNENKIEEIVENKKENINVDTSEDIWKF